MRPGLRSLEFEGRKRKVSPHSRGLPVTAQPVRSPGLKFNPWGRRGTKAGRKGGGISVPPIFEYVARQRRRRVKRLHLPAPIGGSQFVAVTPGDLLACRSRQWRKEIVVKFARIARLVRGHAITICPEPAVGRERLIRVTLSCSSWLEMGLQLKARRRLQCSDA